MPSTPLRAVLSLDRLPPIGQPARVSCQVSSVLAAPNTTIRIELPSNVHVAGGDLEWQGDIPAQASSTITATIVFDTGGNSTIDCRAQAVIDAGNSWGDLASLYLSVGATSTQAGFATSGPAIHGGEQATPRP